MHLLSSFTDDIGLRREPKGSALPKFPSSVSDGGWFRGYTGSLLRCGLSSCSPPCTDLTRNFPRALPPMGLSPTGMSASIAARALASPTTCRLSGKAMARTGLRMMPTFPSPPLKFRTAGFPRYGFKAGLSDKACPVNLRALCFHRSFPALCQGRCAYEHFRASGLPLYPRGPRSGPGYAVPVHHHLVSPIRPTRGHTPTSPHWRLIRDAFAVPIRIGLGNPRLVLSFH